MEGHIQLQQDLRLICQKSKDKIAITFYRKNGTVQEIAYSTLWTIVSERMEMYKLRGFLRGDRVAVLVPLCSDAYIDLLALACIGVTAVILDINLPTQELLRLLNDADVSAIIMTNDLFQSKMTAVEVAVFSHDANCELLAEHGIHHAKDPDFEAIAILYSSGTTSKAKGVVIGYAEERIALDRLLKVVGTSDIRYLMLFPNSHVSGFTDAMVLLLRGGALATMEDASAVQLLKGFQAYKPNSFGMIPKVWETFKNKIEDGIRQKGDAKSKTIFRLIELCGKLRKATGINLGRKLFQSINDEVFGGALENVHVGGGKSNPEVMRFFWNLGYNCFDFYASTEANIPILVTDGRKYMSSLGNITAFDGIDIRIWNPDENGIGEIQVKSDTMMRGYFRNEELTREAFEDGYFKTGDYGKIEGGELYITGRIKESIHLKNGEKISPDDAEEVYRKYLPTDLEFAIAGVPDGDTYDQMCMFVVEKAGAIDNMIVEINKRLSMNYQCHKVEYVSFLPKTSVGKIKRFELRKNYVGGDSKKTDKLCFDDKAPDEARLIELISHYTDVNSITMDSQLTSNLGMDSLSMFEMCISIEEVFHVNIADVLYSDITVKEILDATINDTTSDNKYNMRDFPVERTDEDWNRYREFCEWTERTYDFHVDGLENLNPDENYIFTPNHESHCDGMWMMSKLPFSMQKRLCSFAADYLFDDDALRPGTIIMGGIPVARTGNTIRTMERVYDLLCNEKYSLLIHPEGTRTRNGELGEFKLGAAELSIKTGTKIVPVGICGAKEIFSANMDRPRVDFDENGNKRKLSIHFGVPLSPDQFSNATEYTNKIRAHVINLMSENEFDEVYQIILNHCTNSQIYPDSNLQSELGIDSLRFFEIVSSIEEKYQFKIADGLDQVKTVQDLVDIIKQTQELKGKTGSPVEKEKYPLSRGKWTLWQFRLWIRLMKMLYKIEVVGAEHIPDENVIICSNHINYFDPFWVLAGFSPRKLNLSSVICAIAQERYSEKQSQYYIKLLGGIPINRSGNAISAMQRIITRLSEGDTLILFPEGARSRDGNMLPIKSGVGKIAIASGTDILPVRIDGGFEIWPRHKKLPSLFNWKAMRRHRLTITYKPVIKVEGKSEEEIMKQLTDAISS